MKYFPQDKHTHNDTQNANIFIKHHNLMIFILDLETLGYSTEVWYS